MAEQQFTTDLLRHDSESGPCFTDEANETIENHWDAAASAVRSRFWRAGAVERVASHLDAVDTELLRLGAVHYVYGRLPGVLSDV